MSYGYIFEPLGNHSVYNTLTSAVTFTKPDGATHIAFQPRTKAVYYTIDGTTPTATNGFKVSADDSDVVPVGDSVANIRIVEAEASASVGYIWLLAKGI